MFQTGGEIGGRKVARLLIVIGTAQNIPLTHPNYEANLEFAEKLYKVANSISWSYAANSGTARCPI